MSEVVLNVVCVLASIIDMARGLRLERVDVPSLVELGSTDFVTLDCDYKLEGGEVGEVRWYFDEQETPFYWWSPPRAPRTQGPLAAHVDTNYTVSGDWRVSRRALRLQQLKVALGGRYTCEVTAGDQRARVTTHMLIYSGEHELNVRSRLAPSGGSAPPNDSASPHDSAPSGGSAPPNDSAPSGGSAPPNDSAPPGSRAPPNDSASPHDSAPPGGSAPPDDGAPPGDLLASQLQVVEVVCSVRAVYPLPDLILYHNGRVIEQQWMRAWAEEEGLLSAEARALQPPGAPLAAGGAPDRFACRLTLPAAHYEAVAYTTSDYRPDSQTSAAQKSFGTTHLWLTTLFALFCT